jgi:hypothetical protein
MFSNAFQALLSVAFSSVLKSWSSNSCLIYGPMKIPSFILASFILEIFYLNRQNLCVLYMSISQIFYKSKLDMSWR